MKIILALVTSLDGKSTKNSDPPFMWASKEDQTHLSKLINSQKLIVMGKNTFLSAKKVIKLSLNTLRLVLTKNPEKFKKETVAGQLEFSDESPPQLIKRLSKTYQQMLLLGGANITTEFFKQNLINEILITIEPKIFGKGLGIVNETNMDINLKLEDIKKLNTNGTLLLKYSVLK